MFLSALFWWLFGTVLIGATAGLIWVINLVSSIFLTLREPSSLVTYPRVEGEAIDFQSEDGIRLKGKFIKAQGPSAKGTVIFCPEADGIIDSCSKYTPFLPAHGFHVFSFDFRGHGASDNAHGYIPRQWASSHELYDLFGAIDLVKARPDVDPDKIFLMGVSRGAAVAICTAAIDGHICGIVTDSAFSTKWLLNDYMRKWTGVILPVKKLPTFVYWILEDMGVFASEIKTQCRFPSVEKSLRHLETPILIIHGQKDAYVSLRHGRKLFDITRAPKKFLEVPQARHNESVLVSPDLYEKTVVEFLEGVLRGNSLGTPEGDAL